MRDAIELSPSDVGLDPAENPGKIHRARLPRDFVVPAGLGGFFGCPAGLRKDAAHGIGRHRADQNAGERPGDLYGGRSVAVNEHLHDQLYDGPVDGQWIRSFSPGDYLTFKKLSGGAQYELTYKDKVTRIPPTGAR